MATYWQHTASIYQGARAVGGHLRVDDKIMAFVPHAFDRKTGGKPLTMPLESIVAIERTARSWNPLSFSPRRCLFVRTDDGTEAKLLVNDLTTLMSKLEAAVRQARSE